MSSSVVFFCIWRCNNISHTLPRMNIRTGKTQIIFQIYLCLLNQGRNTNQSIVLEPQPLYTDIRSFKLSGHVYTRSVISEAVCEGKRNKAYFFFSTTRCSCNLLLKYRFCFKLNHIHFFLLSNDTCLQGGSTHCERFRCHVIILFLG